MKYGISVLLVWLGYVMIVFFDILYYMSMYIYIDTGTAPIFPEKEAIA